jgi:LmbE family N-acetylglucosaminyl deacetylase
MIPTRVVLLISTALTFGFLRNARAKLAVRRGLDRVLRSALRIRSHPYVLPTGPNATTLVIAPHPDDEVLGCGGLILRARLEGRRVHVAYITDGSASHPRHPTLTPAVLTQQRQAEARAALQKLGVDRVEVTFLGLKDGSLEHLSVEQAAKLTAGLTDLLRKLQPTDLLVPCSQDGSAEHEATFRRLHAAFHAAAVRPRLLEYPVWAVWNPLRLLRPCFSSRRVWRMNYSGYEALKRNALQEYRSQLEVAPPWTKPVLSRAFVSFFSSGEEYFFES